MAKARKQITRNTAAIVFAAILLSVLGSIWHSPKFKNFLLEMILVDPFHGYLLYRHLPKENRNTKLEGKQVVGINNETFLIMKDQDIQDVLERQLGEKLREQPSDSDNEEFFIMMKNGELTIKGKESIMEELSNSLQSRLTTAAGSSLSMASSGAQDSESPDPPRARNDAAPSKEEGIFPTSKEGDAFDSQKLAVIKSQFCLKMMRPECVVPANAAEISLSDIETIEENVRRLFFWTSMKADLGPQNVVHIWSSSKRPDEWYETVHISIDDKVEKFTVEDEDRLKGHLSKIEQEDPNIHAVQAVVLSLDRSGGFRTYSSIRAAPGKYTVELRYPDGRTIVPGGGAKTIVIEPSH